MIKKHFLTAVTLIFVMTILTACQLPLTSPEEKTVYVAPYRVDCQGEGPQMCLQVKENPEDEYSLFYDQIEGFDYEEGYEYVIKVREETVDNPPAGGSSIRWVLVEVVSKTQSQTAESVPGVEGRLWELKFYLNNQGDMKDLVPGSDITIEFMQGAVSGNAGCNNYFGAYQVEGNQLKFTEIGSTEMFCGNPEGVMDQEDDYLADLVLAASYRIADEQLTISNSEGEALLIYSHATSLLLVGPDWKLDFYNNGVGAIVDVVKGTEINAQFSDNGDLTGYGGCNNYKATYVLDGKNLAVSPLVTTNANCSEPDGTMEQESAYLAALESSTSYQIQGDTLTMQDIDGVRLLSYSGEIEEQVVIPTAAESPHGLVGPLWKWVEFIEAGEDRLIVDDPVKYTIEFQDDGQLNVQADCNSAAGTFEEDGAQIAIEIMSSTMAICPPGSLSEGYLRLLNDTVSYTLEDEFLYLVIQNQTGRLAFSNAAEITLPPTAIPTQAPTATETPFPTETPVPTSTPEPTTTPLPDAVFRDDFSGDTGWTLYKSETHGFAIKDGAYYITVKTQNGWIWSVRSIFLTDGIVETDAAITEGSQTGYYGPVCRFTNGSNYYAFVINEAGDYGILKMELGTLEFISQGKDENGVINRDGNLNRIRGDCVGDALTLYVNGQKLLEIQDSTFEEGNVGLISLTYKEQLLKVMFDVFAVYEK